MLIAKIHGNALASELYFCKYEGLVPIEMSILLGITDGYLYMYLEKYLEDFERQGRNFEFSSERLDRLVKIFEETRPVLDVLRELNRHKWNYSRLVRLIHPAYLYQIRMEDHEFSADDIEKLDKLTEIHEAFGQEIYQRYLMTLLK